MSHRTSSFHLYITTPHQQRWILAPKTPLTPCGGDLPITQGHVEGHKCAKMLFLPCLIQREPWLTHAPVNRARHVLNCNSTMVNIRGEREFGGLYLNSQINLLLSSSRHDRAKPSICCMSLTYLASLSAYFYVFIRYQERLTEYFKKVLDHFF